VRAAATAGDQVAALRNELEALRIDASGSTSSIREELTALRESALSSLGEEELESLREELAAARAQAVQVAERLRELEGMGGAQGAGSAEAAQGIAEVRERAAQMQSQLEEVRNLAAETNAARRDADAAKRGAEAADQRAEDASTAARRHLAEMRAGVESASLESKLVRGQAEAARVAAEDAARYAEAVREIAEALANEAESQAEEDDGRAPLLGKKDTGPSRDPIAGFDDAGQPMARIALDGRFKELNDGFTELVGYSESDFSVASWPPVADRRQVDHHREQMRTMLEGKLESAEIDTGYVHAQGLLVPMAGTLSLIRDEDGEPAYFQLAVLPPTRAAAAA
jgi:PAS domain S-box-containing protein